MKNDKKIDHKLKEIQEQIDYLLNLPNHDAHSDRILERVIENIKEVEKLHNER